MKAFKKIALVLLMTMFVSSLAAVPGYAAGLQGEEFNLASEESGYKIIVPGYIDYKSVASTDVDGMPIEEMSIVMETPAKAADGTYPIFEIVTTDTKAHKIDSYPGSLQDGQLGNFEGTFKDGRLVYSPKFSISKDLKEIVEDKIFTFSFAVYDEAGEYVIDFIDLYFVFVNKDGATETAQETTTAPAKPTASKVVVDGKQIAFEAYNISGNNYFKLRDLAMVVNGTGKQFQVGFDNTTKAINLTTDEAYTPDGKELVVSETPSIKQAKLTQSKIYIDGNELQLTVYNIGGNNYFKLRDIAKAIDFNVTWDAKLSTVGIDTTASYVEPQ